MPRRARNATGGLVYHVLNRGVARLSLFEKAGDYSAFLSIMGEVQLVVPIRVLSFCLMPNHWHLVLWPEEDGELSEFMRLITVTHVQRWHAHYGTAGCGSIYQGRYKCFPVKDDSHFLTVARYVERNALRANLVRKAEEWPWSSLALRRAGASADLVRLTDWPVPQPIDWTQLVNRAETESELQALRLSVQKGAPFGDPEWQEKTAQILKIESSLRPPGRPPTMTPR